MPTFDASVEIMQGHANTLTPEVVPTGTAGIPGTWTADVANMQPYTHPADFADANAKGVAASPTSAWTTGQYVQGTTAGNPGKMNWTGTAWALGAHA